MNILGFFEYLFASVGPFFILLGLLIFVHELGHFLVAKFFGVRVETFSLGFGKKLLRYKKGDTTYCISAIPLGGYVKMFGDDPTADVPEPEKKYAFLHKPVGPRIAIVLAGPLMNLFFAILIFTLIGGVGEDLPGPTVGDVAVDSAAYEDGFRSGDKILAINGEKMPSWVHIKDVVEASGGQALEFVVERTGEPQPLTLQAAVTMGDNENIFSTERKIGQIPGLTQEARSTLVGVKDPQSPAARAGIKSLDLVVSVGDQRVNYWRELPPALQRALTTGSADSKSVKIQVRDVSKDEKPENVRTVQIPVSADWNENTDLVAALGLEPAELYIYQTKKGSPADVAGVQAGDKVIRIDGQEVHTWKDVLERVKSFDPASQGMAFTVVRAGEEKTFTIRPEMTKLMTMKGQEEKRFTIGIVSGFLPVGAQPVFHRISNPVEMIKFGLTETKKWTEFVVMSVVRLVQGDVSPKNIGGVITIGRVASHSFEAGLSTFLRTMAIISINLFLLNLLPIPILDGGHLLFYCIEGIRGAPMSLRKMELAQQVGLMLLMILMVFAFFNDITNLFFNRW
ncbi:MAG: RIP metalloprotease RseP [Bdellovibrionales bacterium]